MKINSHRKVFLIFIVVGTILCFSERISAQTKINYIRIARIVIDSTKLESYQAALKEEIETSVRVEAGVLLLNAVYDKEHPSHVTLFEIYADMDGYKAHIDRKSVV